MAPVHPALQSPSIPHLPPIKRQSTDDVVRALILNITDIIGKDKADTLSNNTPARTRKRKSRQLISLDDARPKRGNYFDSHYRGYRNAPKAFYDQTGITPSEFDFIIDLWEANKIIIQGASAEECLFMTLCYLAHGLCFSIVNLMFNRCNSGNVIETTCKEIFRVLQPIYMKTAKIEDFARIAEEFEAEYRIPYCLGPVDAMQIRITSRDPVDQNYTSQQSVNLQASADIHCRFVVHSMGREGGKTTNGTQAEKKPWTSTVIAESEDAESAQPLPEHVDFRPLFDHQHYTKPWRAKPYFFIGDGAPAGTVEYTMVHYALKNFPEEFTQVRGLTRLAFGILAKRWRILMNPVRASKLSRVEGIIKACLVLHNFRITREIEEMHRSQQSWNVEEVEVDFGCQSESNELIGDDGDESN